MRGVSAKSMKCRLCNLEKDLKRSHIIPEFIFKPLYDSKHRFHKIVADRGKVNTYLQKGFREPLLCLGCEEILSKNEKYVAEIFSGKREILLTNVDGLVVAKGIDYAKFKLFALSVLWRAGVSSDQFFREVMLGVHEVRIRKMLLNNCPGTVSEYPFLLTLVLHENELLSGLIIEPERVKLAGHNAYRFVFSGLVWIFVVSSHMIPNILQDASINESGQFKLLPRKVSELQFITKQAAELSAMGKLDHELR